MLVKILGSNYLAKITTSKYVENVLVKINWSLMLSAHKARPLKSDIMNYFIPEEDPRDS